MRALSFAPVAVLLACTGTATPGAAKDGAPDASVVDAGQDAGNADAGVDAGPPVDPFAVLPATVEAMEAARQVAWAKNQDPDGQWDVVYDGAGTPSDAKAYPYLWDNPVDDDWDDPMWKFQFDTPSPGYLTVDRVDNPRNFLNGNIWRRDEFLTPGLGFTLELRVNIKPTSNDDAFFINFVNQVGSLGILLSPSHVRAGTIDPHSGTTQFEFDYNNFGDFRTYRLTLAPGSSTYDLYIDGTAVGSGQLDPAFHAGSVSNIDFPYVLLGDNSGAPDRNAYYVLDYVKYRRGAFAPADALPPVDRRVPQPLPPAADANETFTVGFDGTAAPPQDPGALRPNPSNPVCYSELCTGAPGNWKPMGSGATAAVELDNSAYLAGASVDNAPGLTDKGGFTIELVFQIFPDSQTRSFVFTHLDEMGSISVSLDPDGVEAFEGLKPVGFQKFHVDLTDRFHTLRIVRGANQLYAHFYLDAHAVPIIVDQHLDGSTEVYGQLPQTPYIQLGYLGYPEKDRHCHVLLENVRWHAGANAPPP